MAFTIPTYYFTMKRDIRVMVPLLEKARMEIDTGNEVEFNGKLYESYDLLFEEIIIYCLDEEEKL
jgi:hypothetical protein